MNEIQVSFIENSGSVTRTAIPVTAAFNATLNQDLMTFLYDDGYVLGSLAKTPTYIQKTAVAITTGTGSAPFQVTPPATAQRGNKWLISGMIGATSVSFTIGTANAARLTQGSDTLAPSAYTALETLLIGYGWTGITDMKFRNYSIQ